MDQSNQSADKTHTTELLEYLLKQNFKVRHLESSNNSVVSVIVQAYSRKRKSHDANRISNKVVVKEIKHKKDNQHCEQCYDLKNEVEKLNQMNHKHIIQLHDKKIYEFPQSCAIFLPKAKEDLFDYMLRYNSEDNLKSIKICFYQIAQAIKYLHQEKNLVHGDIKPENIFVFSRNDFRLADFGFCKPYKVYSKREEFKDIYQTRSVKYLPPEFVDCLEKSNFNMNLINEYSSDVFGLGVTLFQIIFKQCPFNQNEEFYCTNSSNEQLEIIQQSPNQQGVGSDIKQITMQQMKAVKLYPNNDKKQYHSPVSTGGTNKTSQNSPSNYSTSPQQVTTKKKKKHYNKLKYYHREDKLYKYLYNPNEIEEFWNYFHPEFRDIMRNTDLNQNDFDVLKDLIQRSITPIHYLRLSISEFLAHPFFSEIFQDYDEQYEDSF